MKVEIIRWPDCEQVFIQDLEAGFGSVFAAKFTTIITESGYVIIKGYDEKQSLVLILTIRQEAFWGIEDRRTQNEKEVKNIQ